MRETEQYYFFWKHQFGQWTLRDITDPDGIIYNCCEQYMMYKKAVLFNDSEMANEILSEKEPALQQKMGRKIRNFDALIWDRNKVGIVWYGNYLKFTQHEDLKKKLLDTGIKILVEASPYDLIWGVGLGENDDIILNHNNWRGLNLLGKTLISVRSALQFNEKEQNLIT